MKMKHIIVLFATLAVAIATRPGLRAKFNIGLWPGRDFFFDVPRYMDDAVAKDWTLLPRPSGPMQELVMYCSPERVICTLHDSVTTYVAGVQIALPLNEFTGAIYDWDVQGFVPWTPESEDTSEPVTYMTKLLLFVSDVTLKSTKEDRLRQARVDEVLQENAVWVTSFNQELLKISADKSDIESSVFTQQACIPWMGRHYYYNMSATTECSASTLLNWFPLVHNDRLIGIGFLAFGAQPEKDGERYWFEAPPKLVVQTIVPRGPQCLYDLTDDPTITTMHIYFIDEPWGLGCLLQ